MYNDIVQTHSTDAIHQTTKQGLKYVLVCMITSYNVCFLVFFFFRLALLATVGVHKVFTSYSLHTRDMPL